MADPRIDSLVGRIIENPPVKSHQFDAYMFPPALVASPFGVIMQPGYDVNTAFSIPVVSFSTGTRSLEIKEYAYYGVKRKIPYKRKYGNLAITFKLAQDGKIQKVIEEWMDLLINPVTDILTEFQKISPGRITLQERKFNNKGNGSGAGPRYEFFEAFPIEILPILFSNEEKNSTVNYEVIFAYKDYKFDN
jgi:hypothetical protein